jgi:hypothetical protein
MFEERFMTTPEGPTESSLVEPTPAPVPDEPVQAPAADAPEPGAARSRSRKVAQVAGIVGIVVCLLLAGVVLLGRAWLADGLDQVFAAGDAAFETGIATIDEAGARVADRTAELNDLVGALEATAADSPVPAALAARVVSLGDRYDELRERYVALRDRIRSAVRYVRLVDRLVPAVTLPAEPAAPLAELDARITALDERISSLRAPAFVAGKAQDVAVAVSGLRSRAGELVASAGTVRTAVVDMRAKVAEVGGSIDMLLWIAAGGVLFVLAYIAILNGVIVWLARR